MRSGYSTFPAWLDESPGPGRGSAFGTQHREAGFEMGAPPSKRDRLSWPDVTMHSSRINCEVAARCADPVDGITLVMPLCTPSVLLARASHWHTTGSPSSRTGNRPPEPRSRFLSVWFGTTLGNRPIRDPGSISLGACPRAGSIPAPGTKELAPLPLTWIVFPKR